MEALAHERERHQHLVALRRDTTRKIAFVRKKAVIEHHEVYQLIKEFFKEFLEKRYEFTITELRGELKRVYVSNQTRQLIGTILDRLEAAEYATVHYTREDLIAILKDFEEAINQLVRVHVTPKTWFTRIHQFFFPEPDPSTIISDLPVIEGQDATNIRIHTLIERCYVALDKHRLGKAKAAYEALLQEYERLDDEKKKEHFHLIEQTYYDLMHRAKADA
jgi:hypothetical protein